LAVRTVAGRQGDIVLTYADINGTPKTATSSTIGAVKPGTGLSLSVDGTLNVGGSVALLLKSDTPPTGAKDNDIWYDGVSGRLYVYYNYAWVDASPGIRTPSTITATTQLTLISPIPSVSSATGALIVAGGAGIAGDLNVGGRVIANRLIANSIVGTTGSNANIVVDPDGIGDVYFTTGTAVYINDTGTTISTATGALVVAGGVGIGGNLSVGGVIYGTVSSSTSLTNGTWTAYISNTGTLVLPNNLQVVNTEYVNNIIVNTETVTGSIVFPDNTRQSTAFFGTGSLVYQTVNAYRLASQDTIQPNIGISIVTTGSTITNAVVPNNTALDLGITSSRFNAAYINSASIAASIISTSTTTGALVVAGGVGVGGNLYATQLYDNGSRVITAATLGGSGVTSLNGGTGTVVNTATGSVSVWLNTATLVATAVNITNTASTMVAYAATATSLATSQVRIYINTLSNALLPSSDSTVDLGSTSTRFRTLYITSSTIDLGGTPLSAVNGQLSVSGSVVASNTGTTASFYISNSTASTSTTTGALTVAGGAGIRGSLYVGSNTTVGGTLQVTGNFPGITLASNSAGAYGYNALQLLSFSTVGDSTLFTIGLQNILNTATLHFNVTKPTLGYAVQDQYYTGDTLFSGNSNPNLRISFAGTITVYNSSTAISTTTGALQVKGGVGVGGNLYVGGSAYDSKGQLSTRAFSVAMSIAVSM
jgi:hypothetical protein